MRMTRMSWCDGGGVDGHSMSEMGQCWHPQQRIHCQCENVTRQAPGVEVEGRSEGKGRSDRERYPGGRKNRLDANERTVDPAGCWCAVGCSRLGWHGWNCSS